MLYRDLKLRVEVICLSRVLLFILYSTVAVRFPEKRGLRYHIDTCLLVIRSVDDGQ